MKFGNSVKSPNEKDGYFSYLTTDASTKPKCFVLGTKAGQVYIVNLSKEQAKSVASGDKTVSHVEKLPGVSYLDHTTCEVTDSLRSRAVSALRRKIPRDVATLAELGLSVEDAVQMVKNAPDRH
jgi:hypothetical protein